MNTPICDVCKLHDAVGFMQYYRKDTGETLDDYMGPNVCEACCEALCDNDDLPDTTE